MNSKNVSIILSIHSILLLGLILGFGILLYRGSGSSQGKSLNITTPIQDQRFIIGVVEKVSKGMLTIRADQSLLYKPLPRATYELSIQESKLFKQVPKDQAVFQKELSAYKPSAPGSAVVTQIPNPFILEEITIKDVRVGDRITANFLEPLGNEANVQPFEIRLLPAVSTQPTP